MNNILVTWDDKTKTRLPDYVAACFTSAAAAALRLCWLRAPVRWMDDGGRMERMEGWRSDGANTNLPDVDLFRLIGQYGKRLEGRKGKESM